MVPKRIDLLVPPGSKLSSADGILFNKFKYEILKLSQVEIDNILIPEISETEKNMYKSLQRVEEVINSENNLWVNILKYSFLLRFFSNNQIIALASLMNVRIPINLHSSTQSLSSGLKPRSEKYRQNILESKDEYMVIFGLKVEKNQLSLESPIL